VALGHSYSVDVDGCGAGALDEEAHEVELVALLFLGLFIDLLLAMYFRKLVIQNCMIVITEIRSTTGVMIYKSVLYVVWSKFK